MVKWHMSTKSVDHWHIVGEKACWRIPLGCHVGSSFQFVHLGDEKKRAFFFRAFRLEPVAAAAACHRLWLYGLQQWIPIVQGWSKPPNAKLCNDFGAYQPCWLYSQLAYLSKRAFLYLKCGSKLPNRRIPRTPWGCFNDVSQFLAIGAHHCKNTLTSALWIY